MVLSIRYRRLHSYLLKALHISERITIPSAIFSALFHSLVIILIFALFSHKNSIINSDNFKISPVAVISGQEFESFKSSFSKKIDKKKQIITKKTAISEMKIVENKQEESRLGNKKSTNEEGLNLDLPINNSQDYNNSYVNIIANQLEKHKSYIAMDYAPTNVQDQVILKLKLTENGDLSSFKVIEYSNYQFFDKAAQKIVQIASPFPKPPLELKGSLEFIVPILFDTI